MKQNEAEKILNDTFDNKFDEDKFRRFLREFFKDFEEINEQKALYDFFKDSIKSWKKIGKYIDSDHNKIDILAVKLRKETSLGRARTMQRNFIAWYLKNYEKDAALVAYYTEGSEDWRLSFVKSEFISKIDEKGKVKTKQIWTLPKRYSFLIEKGLNHTVKKQLLPVLLDDSLRPSMLTIENNFNIETLTEEFFKEYKELFIKTKENIEDIYKNDIDVKTEFDSKEIDIPDFSKKLLGQIVFLYFLQKKGWLGVEKDENGIYKKFGHGHKNFLKMLFGNNEDNIEPLIKYDNFFNDILEPLFYKALAYKRDNDEFEPLKCRIPFLNGGLFEPINNYDWENINIKIDNKIFEEIFKTFNLYNFTITEDQPLEKEYALDPELLGEIFQRSLDIKERKSKGAVYTPRDIVHYMCQESLINYLDISFNKIIKDNPQQESMFITSGSGKLKLKENQPSKIINREDILEFIKNGELAVEVNKTDSYKYQLPDSIINNAKQIDDLLKNIKICDPAIGSGAFPVGIMGEIVKARNILSRTDEFKNDKTRNLYSFKLNAIQNSIYGVDLDSSAIDIARLRLWLSLIVDQEINANEEEVKALPNLDYKIVQGNSLISSFMGIDLDFSENKKGQVDIFDNGYEVSQLIKNIKDKKDYFLTVSDHNEKKKAKDYIESNIVKLFEKKLEIEKKQDFDKLKRINEKSESIPNKTDRENYVVKEKQDLYNKSGFNLESIENDFKLAFNKRNRNFFSWELNFSEVFDKSKDSHGFDIIIANPPYVRADVDDDQFQKNRKEIEKSGKFETLYEKWDIFIPFIEIGLKMLSQNGNLKYITSNSLCTSKYALKLLELIQKDYYVNSLDYFEEMEVFKKVGVVPVIIGVNKSSYNDVVRNIRSGSFENIIDQKKLSISEFKEKKINAFKKEYNPSEINVPCEELGNICYISKGMVTNSDEKKAKGEFTKDDLIYDKPSLKIPTKRYVEGKNIKKYKVEKVKYLEYGTERSPSKLVRQTFPELYDRPKIMRGRVTDGIYDETGLICNDSIMLFVRFIDLKEINNRSILGSIKKSNKLHRQDLEKLSLNYNLKYLLAIINSKFANHFLNNIRRHRLENYFYPDDLRNLLIRKIDIEIQNIFAILVDYITFLKSIELSTARERLMPIYFEQIIDAMVYELYFEDSVKKNDREIIKYLYDLKPFITKMDYSEKLEITSYEFNKLDSINHPVRNNVFFMDSIEEVRIIEGKK